MLFSSLLDHSEASLSIMPLCRHFGMIKDISEGKINSVPGAPVDQGKAAAASSSAQGLYY